jgi:proliferating cell nuclear antigen
MAMDDDAVQSMRSLEVRTVQAPVFKVLVEAMKELMTETCIEFDETGMKIMEMDSQHIVMAHLKLDAGKFEYYHCPARLCIGVDMLNMYKLIKTINSNDTLTLYIDADDVNHLCIKIENVDKNRRTVYKLDLLDLPHKDIFAEPTDFTEVVTLPCADFQKICRDMHNLADTIEIKSIRGQLIFSCHGDFCSQETVICDNEVDAAASSDIFQGVFSLKHLVLFTKCTNLCPTMELYLKNDYPLIIKYDVSSLGCIRLVLAGK